MNPIHEPVTLEIGGKTRQLFYEHRDFATGDYLLQKQGWHFNILGPQGQEFWESLIAGSHFHIGVLLFVGLCRQNPKLTLPETQDMITFENVAKVADTVVEAAVSVLKSLVPEKDRIKQPEEASADASPLPSSSGGASAGPSEDTTSASPTENSGDSGQMNLISSAGGAT